MANILFWLPMYGGKHMVNIRPGNVEKDLKPITIVRFICKSFGPNQSICALQLGGYVSPMGDIY